MDGAWLWVVHFFVKRTGVIGNSQSLGYFTISPRNHPRPHTPAHPAAPPQDAHKGRPYYGRGTWLWVVHFFVKRTGVICTSHSLGYFTISPCNQPRPHTPAHPRRPATGRTQGASRLWTGAWLWVVHFFVKRTGVICNSHSLGYFTISPCNQPRPHTPAHPAAPPQDAHKGRPYYGRGLVVGRTFFRETNGGYWEFAVPGLLHHLALQPTPAPHPGPPRRPATGRTQGASLLWTGLGCGVVHFFVKRTGVICNSHSLGYSHHLALGTNPGPTPRPTPPPRHRTHTRGVPYYGRGLVAGRTFFRKTNGVICNSHSLGYFTILPCSQPRPHTPGPTPPPRHRTHTRGVPTMDGDLVVGRNIILVKRDGGLPAITFLTWFT